MALVDEIRCVDVSSTQRECKLLYGGNVRLEGIVEDGEIPSARTTRYNHSLKSWIFGIDNSECNISGTTLICRRK